MLLFTLKERKVLKMMVLKCEKCGHKEVCSHKKQMENLNAELSDKMKLPPDLIMKLMENKNFRLELHCNFFTQEGVTLK